jgi:hypothetical protein
MDSVIVGSRIKIGAALNGIAGAAAYFFPDQAPAILSLAIPVTFAAQTLWVNLVGVTVK